MLSIFDRTFLNGNIKSFATKTVFCTKKQIFPISVMREQQICRKKISYLFFRSRLERVNEAINQKYNYDCVFVMVFRSSESAANVIEYINMKDCSSISKTFARDAIICQPRQTNFLNKNDRLLYIPISDDINLNSFNCTT